MKASVPGRSSLIGISGHIPRLSVEVEVTRDRAVLRLRGELDLAGSVTLLEALDRCGAYAKQLLVLDLSRLDFIDVCGVGSLLSAERRARAHAHSVAVVPGRGEVARIFELIGLAGHLPVVESVA